MKFTGCNLFVNIKLFVFPCVLSQRVYDEEVEETITKTDGLEKQPEQVEQIRQSYA